MVDYTKLTIAEENQKLENRVLERINTCIEDKQSWAFNAGAGSGKTYTLVQSINAVLDKEKNSLKQNRQQILCITYTNAAADELKKRLLSTPLVKISTIHEHMWSIIERYKKELLDIHKDKIIRKVEELNSKLEQEKWAKKYAALTEVEKDDFAKIVLDEKFLDRFYANLRVPAAVFKNTFREELGAYSDILSSVGNTRNIIKNLHHKNRLVVLLENWESKIRGKRVRYESRINTDMLHRFLISHDTLLEYSLAIITKFKRLRQVFCDKYPYVFVDEFQDTSPLVAKALAQIEEYAKEIKHCFVVGYYGDTCQNIYEAGVGDRLYALHKDLVKIDKVYNRRSSQPIIDIGNAIRNDSLKQTTIYDNFPKGHVECSIYPQSTSIDELVAKITTEWKLGAGEKLHCLVLTNALVAEKNHFKEFFQFFEQTPYYKANYNNLTDQVLSQDKNKLHDTVKILYEIMEFRAKVENKHTCFHNLFDVKKMDKATKEKLNIITLRALADKLADIKGDTLGEYVADIFVHRASDDCLYDECVKNIFIDEVTSLEDLKNIFKDKLFFMNGDIDEEQEEKYSNDIDAFFNLNIEILVNWFNYINRKYSEKDVVFHTYHSTKGLEFENLIVFLSKKFGKEKDYFKNFFEHYLDGEALDDKCRQARNLLYVAVTRAIKNLHVVYLLDSGEDKEVVKKQLMQIFNQVQDGTSENN